MGLLSKRCEYGIRAVLYLATREGNSYVPIREISERLGVSFHFLTKVLQDLTDAGLMHSFRGPNGGVALAQPASQVSMAEIVQTLEGPGLFEACILGLPNCGEARPCPMHAHWSGIRASLHQMFSGITVADLAHQLETQNLRIAEV
jgi:Rrf2 family protein